MPIGNSHYGAQNRGYQSRGGGRDKLEIEIDIYTPLYIKQITNKGILYSTGTSSQYSVMTCMGKESKKDWIYV